MKKVTVPKDLREYEHHDGFRTNVYRALAVTEEKAVMVDSELSPQKIPSILPDEFKESLQNEDLTLVEPEDCPPYKID